MSRRAPSAMGPNSTVRGGERQPAMYAYIVLSLLTGARTEELRALTWSHVDLDGDGQPQSTLTDNGSVYASRFTGGRNGFEYLLASLGIAQKNRHPGHPQTQGKIERFHQTLKRWLAARPAAATVAELQTQLDTFTHIYNQTRPHRA